MLSFKQYIEENNTESHLTSILSDYRKQIESDYDEDDSHDTICSDLQGSCNYHAKKLATILKSHGYDATPVMGKFKDVSDDYVPSHWDDSVNKKLYKHREKHGKFPAITHAWVNIKHNNKNYIADTTADQFTKNKEDSVILSNKDSRYTKPKMVLSDEDV